MSVRLFDVNAMVGRMPDAAEGGSAEQLRQSLARVGVEAAVVSHLRAWQHDVASGNRLLLTELADQPRLYPCWVAVPDTCAELGGASEFVSDAAAAGVVAVRMFPAEHGFGLAGRDAASLLAALAEAALPLLVDAEQTSWDEIETAARAHPALPLVACTVGYRALRRAAGVLARTDNVLLDLSYLGTHLGLEWVVERFGAQRLLFGTGAPRRDPADAVTRLLWSALDDDAVSAIGASNLAGLVAASADVTR